MARYGNVDERIVEMQFDNQQFEKNANESISTLEKLKKALNLEGAAQGFEEIDKASKGFNFTALQNGVDAIGEKFSMMGILGITAMQRISNAAIDMGINLGKTLVGLDGISEGFSRYAEKSNHVKTIMTATGESIENVSDVLDDLNWFTDETSYRFTDMVNTMGKFTSAGVKLDVAKEAVEGIALWAAESGQNAQTASRAMFQLAQAYGRGTIQLQDWMSVEQANMSTAKIQNELIKEGGEVAEKAIAKYGGFRDSLRSGWLTTEIFNNVMQKYSEGVTEANYANGKFTGGVTEMSEAAFKAAQEARTYKDAIDAVKEAVSTGWSHTFELVFGNAEEAAIVWTDLANSLIGVADKFTAFRNDVLEVWNDIGGRDKLVESAYNMLGGVGKIGNTIGKSFSEAFHLSKGLDELKNSEWATTYEARELFYELDSLYEQMGRMKRNGDSIERLEEWQQKIDDVMGSLNAMDRAHSLDNISEKLLTFSDRFKEVIHYEDTISKNVKRINELKDILSDLGTGLDTSSRRRAIQEEIDTLTKANEEYKRFGLIGERLKDIWGVFLSVARVGKEIFDGLVDAIRPVISVLSGLLEPILNLAGSFGRVIKAFNDALVKSGIIKESFGSIGELLANFLGPIVDFIADKINKLADIFDGVAESIENGIVPISEWLTKAKQTIVNFFESLDFEIPNISEGESVLGKIVGIFSGFLKSMDPLSERIGNVVTELWEVIKTVFGKLCDILSDVVKQLGLTVGNGNNVIENLYEFASAIMSLWLMFTGGQFMKSKSKDSGGIGKAFTDVLDGLSDALSGLGQKFKGNFIESLGKGLLELAGALFVISLIDSNKLLGAVGAIEVIMFTLSKILNSLGSDDMKGAITGLLDSGKFAAIGKVIQSIGTAILMISGSLWIIGQMDTGRVIQSVVALGVILQMFGRYAKQTKDITGFKSDGLIKMAVGLFIIAASIKKLGDLELENCIQGVVALGVILAELAGYQILLNKFADGGSNVGAGMILLAASMLIFAQAIKSMGNIPVDTLNQGLGALAGVLAGLVVAMIAMKDVNVLGIAAGMLVLSFAIANIAAVIALLGKAKWQTLAKGLTAVVGAVAAIGLVLSLMSDFTNGGHGLVAAAGAILIVAAAMNLLMVPLLLLGQMELGQIGVALLGMAGALIILGVAAKALTGSELTLLALGAAMTLIGVGLVAIGAGLGMIAASLVAAVGSIMTSLSMIVLGLGTFLASLVVALAEAAGSIALAIGILGAAILSGLTMLIGPAVELIMTLIDEVARALAEHAPTIGANLILLLAGLVDIIAAYLPILVNSGVNLVISFVDGIAHGIIDNTDRALDAFDNLINSIIYFALGSLERLASNIPVIGDDIANGIGQMQEGIKNGMKDVGVTTGDTVADEMAHGRPAVKEEGGNYANEFHNGMTETISGGLFGDIPGMIHQYMYSGGTESSGGGTFAADFLQGEKDGILGAIPETFGDGSIAASLAQNLMPEEGPQNEIFSGGLNTMFDTGKQTFDDRIPEYLTSGEEIPTQIQTGIGNKEKATVDKVKTLANNMDAPVSELPGKAKQHTDDAMQGMINSVDANWDRVVGKFQALAAACSGALSSVWDEHSPSRVFFRHTTNALLGMVNAVDVNGHMPVDAITNVAQSMVDAVDEKIGQYGSISPTITPVVDLTNATNAAGTIDSMINAQRTSALSAQMSINSQITQMDQLVDMTSRILGAVQNGSDLYLDDSILAGRINRRLGVL